jgi:hypothetical protein
MPTKDLLAKAIAVITFLFAAFSGFLTNVAPPEEAESSFAVGLSSFVALAVFLTLSAVSKNQQQKRHKGIWLAVAIASLVTALATAFLYRANLDELTFLFPPETQTTRYVQGAVLTPAANQYRTENPQKTISEMVADYGGIPAKELVWTPESLRSAKLKLTINYVALVLSLAITVFSLTEGLLVEPQLKQQAVSSKVDE